MEIPSGLTMNSLIWLTSPRPDDEGWTARIIEDVDTICRANGVPFQVYTVPSRALLEDTFDKIADAARQGCRPVLHIDMHGSIEHGLEIAGSKEFMSWPALAGKLRGINMATGNNTCVIAASCFAFHAIKQVSITQASPFFLLVAPEDKATVGFLEAKTAAFYAELFSTLDIMQAIANHLTPAMKTFHCERMFMIGLARYILRYCIGKGGAERRESLLTDSVAVAKPRTQGDMRALRKSIKNAIKPDQALVDKFAAVFLAGKPCGFTIDDVMKEAEAAQALKK
jgi:hypothetical protein